MAVLLCGGMIGTSPLVVFWHIISNEKDKVDNLIICLKVMQAHEITLHCHHSIRRAILDRGTKAVLKYLKDKIPE